MNTQLLLDCVDTEENVNIIENGLRLRINNEIIKCIFDRDLPQLNGYIFPWQFSRLSQKKNFESGCEFHLQNKFLSLKAAQCTAAQQSRAELYQPRTDLDDPSPMKMAVFFLGISSGVLSFFKKDIPTQ